MDPDQHSFISENIKISYNLILYTQLIHRSHACWHAYIKYRGPILHVMWPAPGSDDLNFCAICTVSAHWKNKTFKFCRSLSLVSWHVFFYKITTLAMKMLIHKGFQPIVWWCIIWNLLNIALRRTFWLLIWYRFAPFRREI